MEILWPVFWETIKYSQGSACINATTRVVGISRSATGTIRSISLDVSTLKTSNGGLIS